jgi:hypothetical protein
VRWQCNIQPLRHHRSKNIVTHLRLAAVYPPRCFALILISHNRYRKFFARTHWSGLGNNINKNSLTNMWYHCISCISIYRIESKIVPPCMNFTIVQDVFHRIPQQCWNGYWNSDCGYPTLTYMQADPRGGPPESRAKRSSSCPLFRCRPSSINCQFIAFYLSLQN